MSSWQHREVAQLCCCVFDHHPQLLQRQACFSSVFRVEIHVHVVFWLLLMPRSLTVFSHLSWYEVIMVAEQIELQAATDASADVEGTAASAGIGLVLPHITQHAPIPPCVPGPSETAGLEFLEGQDLWRAHGWIDVAKRNQDWYGNLWHQQLRRGIDQ